MGDRAGCARDELLGEKDVWARDRVEFGVKESAVVHGDYEVYHRRWR